MSRDSRLFLEDILESCEKIIAFTADLSQEEFCADIMRYDATLRNLEVIGECVRNLPDNIRVMQPQIPWTKIAATRNIIAHVYFGIDDDIIWDILRNKLPDLHQAVKEILNLLS